MKRGTGPYFYVAKLESHLEARLWNDVFVLAQRLIGVPMGTIRWGKGSHLSVVGGSVHM